MQVVDREPQTTVGRWRVVVLILIVLVVAGAAVWRGVSSRATAMTLLERETRDLAIPTVTVTRAERTNDQEEIALPGSLAAYTDAPIYARTSGYVKRRLVDLGARVRQGQLLAEIDAPEVEQQLQQARADLATAEANAKLAQVTADRYRELRKTESVTAQDMDTAAGTLDVRAATVESARHNVRRLEQLQAFTKIEAPFDGVVTVRNTDVGALIDPGASGGAARELFHVAATDRLRLFVNVPEMYSRAATPGLPAELTLAEFPGRRFAARLVRTSSALDATSRTLLTEFEVPNPKGDLLPGAFAEVHLKLRAGSGGWILPVTTLIFRSQGLQVATVRQEKNDASEVARIVMTSITLGRDFGARVEVLTGLKGDEQIVVSPPDSLADGQTVRILSNAGTEKRQ